MYFSLILHLNMLNSFGLKNSIELLDLSAHFQGQNQINIKDLWSKRKKENKTMKMFYLKLHHKCLKTLIGKYSISSRMLKNILKSGLIMKHYGLLMQRRFTKNLEMILTNGKHCLMKSDKIVELLITVKHKKLLDLSLLITDLY